MNRRVRSKLKERETPEEYQERRKLANERAKRQKNKNETPEQRQRRLEGDRMNRKIRSQKMTPEELEEKRQRERERNKNMTEEQRQKRCEQIHLSVNKIRRNETPEQRAKRVEYNKRWFQRKKLKMAEMERQGELEQETLEDGQTQHQVSRQCKRKQRISECKGNGKNEQCARSAKLTARNRIRQQLELEQETSPALTS